MGFLFMAPSYQVVFPNRGIERQFEKSLGKIPADDRSKIVQAVRKLAVNPRPAGKKYKKLAGEVTVYSFVAQYRLRVGDYRVLYDVDDKNNKVVLLGIVRRTSTTY